MLPEGIDMRSKHVKLVAMACMTALAGSVLVQQGDVATATLSQVQDEQLYSTGRSDAESLKADYDAWAKEYEAGGGDRNLVLPVGAFKGYVTAHTDAKGYARFDLVEGTVSAHFTNLAAEQPWDLWVMQDKVGTMLPDAGDTLIRVGSLEKQQGGLGLQANLGSEAFKNFELSYVIVTPGGKHPSDERTLAGTTTLFHALYRSAQRGQFGVFENAQAAPSEPVAKPGMMANVLDAVVSPANAALGPLVNPTSALDQMITRGRNTFFNETFQGNGRTCGTCHREQESLTIGVDFIADLPPDDPLFVAEFVPALARNFENPVLMRRFALILENLDGFEDPANKFVMRGIPHTLALNANTLRNALVDGTQGVLLGPPAPGTPIGPGTDPTIRERTGWSGDGAPGTGTLREFLTGAIMQHYPRTLGRVAGRDFRLATNQELLDSEAFMKSTGRRRDLNLGGLAPQNPGDPVLRLRDVVAAAGQRIFTAPGNIPGILVGDNRGAGKCFLCHAGGGAGETVEQLLFNQASAIGNGNFDTGVEELPSLPADLAGQPNPTDGGFGKKGTLANGFGDGTFNTPVLIEAADTPGFFHNNAVDTIEAAVAFYQGPAFNSSPAGQLAGGIMLEGTEVEAIAKFLRVLNSIENLNSTIDLLQRARRAGIGQGRELLGIALAELDDAFDVLREGHVHKDARDEILFGTSDTSLASAAGTIGGRNIQIDQALSRAQRAIGRMRF
jgi:hypothetical protein